LEKVEAAAPTNVFVTERFCLQLLTNLTIDGMARAARVQNQRGPCGEGKVSCTCRD